MIGPGPILIGQTLDCQHGMMTTALSEFLFPAPARRNPGAIFRWWESRRPHYNLAVGAAGLFSLAAMRAITMLPPDPHGGFVPLAGVVIVGIMANLCYLLGPLAEITIEKLSRGRILPTGPALYRMGLTFSAGLVLLPTLLVSFDWVFRVVRALT